MKIMVFGSTGRSGREIVQQALDAGHKVTAVARNPESLHIPRVNLTVVKGNVLDAESFRAAIREQDIIISALGSEFNEATKIYSQGIANMLSSMQENEIKRIICISAAAVETNPKLTFLLRIGTKVLQRLLRNPFHDLLLMERLLKASGVNWTVVRPPRLTMKKRREKYRFAINEWLPACASISRADLAHFILNHLEDSNTYQSIVEVAY